MLKPLKKSYLLRLSVQQGSAMRASRIPGAMQTRKNHLPTTLPVPT